MRRGVVRSQGPLLMSLFLTLWCYRLSRGHVGAPSLGSRPSSQPGPETMSTQVSTPSFLGQLRLSGALSGLLPGREIWGLARVQLDERTPESDHVPALCQAQAAWQSLREAAWGSWTIGIGTPGGHRG